MGCAKCGKMMKKGGVKKMAAGGSTTNKLNNAKGFAPAQKGGDNGKKMIYGVPNAGMTGPNRNSQTETMKKGGAKKTTAKKPLMKKGGAMKPLRKAQDGDNFQGPVTQEATNKINKDYTRAVGVGPRVYDQTVKDADDWKNVRENYDRIPKEVFDEYKKGGSVKKTTKKYAKGGSTFGMLSVKAGVDNNPKPTAADRIAGAKMSSPKKAKFGASVSVQRSPKAGKIRSASAQGYSAVGKREPGRIIKKTIGKKK